ncbi:MAG: HIT family protein [Syntrophobacteraceae bacterium]|nr:HIT family protein [Syntrophobacteraceae bacterium]
MSAGQCPFCHPDHSRVFYEGNLVIGLWDSFPVSDGHVLLIPRRHVADWFEATPEEQAELMAAIDVARKNILARFSPDGFNLGVNIGEVAGQTIFHLHLHVIPRYRGDVEDPTGGVRNVIPARGNYLKWNILKENRAEKDIPG